MPICLTTQKGFENLICFVLQINFMTNVFISKLDILKYMVLVIMLVPPYCGGFELGLRSVSFLFFLKIFYSKENLTNPVLNTN